MIQLRSRLTTSASEQRFYPVAQETRSLYFMPPARPQRGSLSNAVYLYFIGLILPSSALPTCHSFEPTNRPRHFAAEKLITGSTTTPSNFQSRTSGAESVGRGGSAGATPSGQMRQEAILDQVDRHATICLALGWACPRSPLSPPDIAKLRQHSRDPKCVPCLDFCDVANQEDQWPS